MKTFRRIALLLAALGFIHPVSAQISVTGVADRTSYTDQATFRVVPQAGYNYEATLNGAAMPVGSPVVVDRMDHYELQVTATPSAGGTPISQLIQFIVNDADRGSPENGLIKWVPYPPIPSASGEYAGAQLELIHPAVYPTGLDLPIIALVNDSQGNARRVNGTITFSDSTLDSFRLVRGVGFGFSRPANTGVVPIHATVGTLTVNRSVTVSPAAWSDTSGVLPAQSSWTEDSRISVTGNLTVPAGGQLEIEAGTIVRLMPGVNITNNGRIVLRGTRSTPIVFTATNRVAPEARAGAWGGFVMRNAGAEIVGEGAIFTGSGAAASFSFSPSTSHRSEQALFLAQAGTRIQLTNCYAINQSGQIANGYNADITYDHCLLQRAITAGEYIGGTIVVNHSALLEFPSIDNVYSAAIADADYDGIYFTEGTHLLMNSLFGFAKDDAIDSGSGGAGTVVVSNCWVESALHEGLAWSGGGRQTWTYDTILINNGQGIECGWSTGADSPLCRAERLLSTGNSVGARYGDNYTGTTGLGLKTGFLWLTNALILHNYRDVWGRVWDDTWNYRSNRMDIRSNHLTGFNPIHPDNVIWDSRAHASLLDPFLRTPIESGVGVGLAVWATVQPLSEVTNGIPVRLSTFTSRSVEVSYTVSGPAGTIAEGALRFEPGETVRRISISPALTSTAPILHVTLHSPVAAEVSGQSEAWYLNLPTPPQASTTNLIARGSTWKYLDTGVNAGTAWRAPGFNDSAWASGAAELGFGDGGESTVIRGTNATGARILTTYFRHAFNVPDRTAFASLGLWLWRDDAGVVYLNGTEVYRSPNLPASPTAILFDTLATSTGEDSIDTATLTTAALVDGINVAAIEIHQQSATSSDLSFNFELTGAGATPAPRLEVRPFGRDLLLVWGATDFRLESAPSVTGPWSTAAAAKAPFLVEPTGAGARFYRLRR